MRDSAEILATWRARQIIICFLNAWKAAISHIQVDKAKFIATEAVLHSVSTFGLARHAFTICAKVLVISDSYTELAEVFEAGDLAIHWIICLDKLLRVLDHGSCMSTSKACLILPVSFTAGEAVKTLVFALVPDG